MTATPSIDLPGWMAEQLSQASPDLLRQMVQTFAEALMSADADAVCGAGYGQRSPDRSNTRNGYRHRGWDTRAGSIDLAVPKLREGSYFPEWLLERRRRAESALVSVVAPPTCSVSRPGGWRSWSSSWASPGCRSPRSARLRRTSTPRWRRSAPGRWTPVPTRSSPRTHWC